MIGFELVKDRETKEPLDDKEMFNYLVGTFTHGLLLYYTRNIFGLIPPLIIDEGIADYIVRSLDAGLDAGVRAKLVRNWRLAKEFVATKLAD
jgi:adenosylmethionine-8-amino-7-oxononanoate aminotransferase